MYVCNWVARTHPDGLVGSLRTHGGESIKEEEEEVVCK